MRQRKKKPLKEGMVYCKYCKGNGLIKPYRIELFMVVTNKCKYCGGTGQRYWIDVITGKIPEVKMQGFDISKFRSLGLPIISGSRSRLRSRYSAVMFKKMYYTTSRYMTQRYYSEHINPINYNTWATRSKK